MRLGESSWVWCSEREKVASVSEQTGQAYLGNRDWDPIDPAEATARAWTITDPEVDLLLKWSHHHILKKKVAATESS